MQYRVVPFVANISKGSGPEDAANQLQELINKMAKDGWEYTRLENIEIIVHDPGSPGERGCFGFGAPEGVAPPSQTTTRFDMAVFQKED